jgi:toxin HigB-1
VIVSYRDKRTRTFAEGGAIPAFTAFRAQAARRLAILEAATTLADLQALPSNRLAALRGDRAGQWSIRINLQWRICFEWPVDAPGPANVEIVDYH